MFLFCLAVVGLTNIVVDSTLFAPVRSWLKTRVRPGLFKLVECKQCCGTWAGFLCGLCLVSTNPPVVLACGWAGAFLAPAADQVMTLADHLTKYLNKKVFYE